MQKLAITGVFAAVAHAVACGGEGGVGDVDAGGADADPEGIDAARPEALAITTDSLPGLHVFRPYEATIEITGGTPPYRFRASGLPPGLIIDEDTGRIHNDPNNPAITDARAVDVTVTVVDRDAASQDVLLPLAITPIESIAAGWGFTCALDAVGAAFCWGNGSNLGSANLEDSPVPVPVSGDHTFEAISAGDGHACALDETGAAYCWGENDDGELGNDSAGDRSEIPVEVAGGYSFRAISTGFNHTCALDEEGTAYCWGWNEFGQLGTGDREDRAVPVAVSGGHSFAAISARGYGHTCALDGAGIAYCWGENGNGQLGNDNEPTTSEVPDEVSGDHRFASISVGSSHTCAIDGEGRTFCWGNGSNGQVGNDLYFRVNSIPEEVAGEHRFERISADSAISCAVTAAGGAFCWGDNEFGELGNDDPGNSSAIPVRVRGDYAMAEISAGTNHTCALSSQGTPYCWGRNLFGQLGNSALSGDSPVPVPVEPSL